MSEPTPPEPDSKSDPDGDRPEPMGPEPSSLPNQQAVPAPPTQTPVHVAASAPQPNVAAPSPAQPLGPEPPAPQPSGAQPAGPARLGWLPLAAVGVAGLILGMMIGAVGFGLLSIVWHHGPGAHGDDRGNFWQDDRGGRPERGPFGR